MHISFASLLQVGITLLLVVSHATPLAPYPSHSYLTKELTSADGQTYVYSFASAQNSSKPTLLLLHGYPASRHDWDDQITALVAEGFGIIAPDLLGFGNSSKPTAIEAYNTKTLSDHLTEILDTEGLREVIGVGHDWGALLLAKAVAWYPERFTKIAIVSVPYLPAGQFFDIDAGNKLSQDTLGFQQFGYWYFFNSWDAAGLIKRNLESFFHLLFATNASAWGINFTDLGAARAWLNANITTDLPLWLPAEYKANWLYQFGQPDALAASLNYYRAMLRGTNAPNEVVLTDEDRTIRVPVLAVGATKDSITSPEQQRLSIEPWASVGYVQRIVDAGHWPSLEKADELSEILIEFAQ